MTELNKKPSVKLIIGIVLIPIIFSWFSLKKGYSNKFKAISMAWMVFTILLTVMSPSTETQQTTTVQQNESAQTEQLLSNDDSFETLIISSAVPYSVLRSEDLSHASRSRINANILAPTATTPEQQKGTAAKAAKELQSKNKVQVASVNLFTEKDGIPVIQLNYSPDTKAWSDGEATGNRFNLE